VSCITRSIEDGHWLTWKPLTFVGRVSYGMYVYHIMVIMMMRHALPHLGLSADNPWVALPIDFAMTLLVASASWFLLESPISAMKDRFPYFPGKPTQPRPRPRPRPR